MKGDGDMLAPATRAQVRRLNERIDTLKATLAQRERSLTEAMKENARLRDELAAERTSHTATRSRLNDAMQQETMTPQIKYRPDTPIPDAYEECARCGKFHYAHDAQWLVPSEMHEFVRKPARPTNETTR
jgi:chromosome segregation ATPase